MIRAWLLCVNNKACRQSRLMLLAEIVYMSKIDTTRSPGMRFLWWTPKTRSGLISGRTTSFRKNMKKLRWLFIWQITLSQFHNVSVRFKSASSGNKLEHLEDGLIISFFFCATNAIGLCLCVFCSWFCFAPCSGASQCLGSMWVSLKALIIFFVRLLYLLFIVW